MRNLALYRLCGALCATVNQSNQFLPVTRQLSVTGERERCSILTQGGDASAWPPFCWIVAYKDRVEKRTTETMGRVGTQRLRPTRPPGRSGPLDRTAGGIGGAAPASLDLYGQSRTTLSQPRCFQASCYVTCRLEVRCNKFRLSFNRGKVPARLPRIFCLRALYSPCP